MSGEKKAVLITEASSGIGRACVSRMMQAGWKVFAAVRKNDDAGGLQLECGAAAVPLLMDVTDHASVVAAVVTPYFLREKGGLSPQKPGKEAGEQIQFDPKNPVPSIGGNVSSQGGTMEAGACDQYCRPEVAGCRDQGRLSARADILTFQTSPLEHDLEVTGPLVVHLWASSSAPDTDFTAKLVDVSPPNKDFPNGVELNIADGIVRARYRDSLEKATLMVPGQVYKFQISLNPTSVVFLRGHRIRVDISSSNFPRFDVNPNTGEPLNQNRRYGGCHQHRFS